MAAQEPVAEGLAVDVLGPLVVRRGGEPVDVGGPRPRALLIRLVMSGDLLSTDRLVDDLWSGEPPRSAVNTLQSYVSTLRRALGDVDRSVLLREGPGYRITKGAVALDVDRFTRLVEQARDTADPAERSSRLDEALATWRGPALLDVADEAWARPLASRLDEARLTAVEDRFDALLASGDHVAAASELAAAVQEHPLRERLAYQLVLALYRSGRQADALRAHDRTRERLVEELGVGPGPELTRLHQLVLAQDPSLDPPDRSGRTDGPEADRDPSPLGLPSSQRAAVPAAVVRLGSRPILGRHEELAHLRDRWHATATEGAGLVLLSGEPGIGKSRLAAALAVEAHAGGGTVLWGACPRAASGPFQPFAAALREHLHLLPPPVATDLLDGLGSLHALLPGHLRDQTEAADRPSPSPPGASRYRLFEAATEVLVRLAANGGVLLVIDDLHWADPDTCALLAHVLRSDVTPAPLVVATVRSHDADPNSALVDLIADLQRDRLVARLALRGLSVEAVRELRDLIDAFGTDAPKAASGGIAALESGADAVTIGARPPAIDAAELLRATGGNPYFVEELLAARMDGGAGDSRPGGGPLPESIVDVLRSRFDRLGERVLDVLEVAALIGTELDLALVARATALDEDDLLDRVGRAVEAGLLREPPSHPGRHHFAHELVRQALIDARSTTHLARLHLRIATAIEAGGPDGSLTDTTEAATAIAHHRLAALPFGDPSTAIDAAIEAARHALAGLAFGEARAISQLAIDTVERTGPVVPPELRAALFLELGRTTRAAGDLTASLEAFTTAVDHALRADRPDLEADAVLGAIGPRPTGSRLDHDPADPALLAMVEHSLVSMGDDDPGRRAALLAARSWVQPRSVPVQERTLDLDEALELAGSSDDRTLTARVLLARHAVLAAPEDIHQRIQAAGSAIAHAEEAGADDIEMHAHVAVATDLLELGELDAVHNHVDRMSVLAERLGEPAYRFHPGTFGVMLALLAGRHEEAEGRARALYRDTLALRTGVSARVALGARLFQVARDRGELAVHFAGLSEQLRSSSNPSVNAAYALAAAEVGEHDIACEQLRLVTGGQAALEADEDPVPREALWQATTAMATETAAILGDTLAASVLAARLRPFAGRLVVVGTIACLGSVDRYVGLGHLCVGHLDEADRWLAQGIEVDRRVGAPAFVARGLAERSWVLRQRGRSGDHAEAAESAAEAQAIVEDLGLAVPRLLRSGDADGVGDVA